MDCYLSENLFVANIKSRHLAVGQNDNSIMLVLCFPQIEKLALVFAFLSVSRNVYLFGKSPCQFVCFKSGHISEINTNANVQSGGSIMLLLHWEFAFALCLPMQAFMFVCLCACPLVCLSSVQIANANANVLV